MKVNTKSEKWGKIAAAAVSVLLIVIVLSPVKENWSTDPEDSFPLSYYPMFTKKRGETMKIIHPVGVDSAGNQELLHYKFAASGGMNQVRRQIRKTVRSGDPTELCEKVASKVARKKRSPYTEMGEVQLVTSEYHISDYFTEVNQQPVFRKVNHTCEVKRGES